MIKSLPVIEDSKGNMFNAEAIMQRETCPRELKLCGKALIVNLLTALNTIEEIKFPLQAMPVQQVAPFQEVAQSMPFVAAETGNDKNKHIVSLRNSIHLYKKANFKEPKLILIGYILFNELFTTDNEGCFSDEHTEKPKLLGIRYVITGVKDEFDVY